MKRYAIVMMLLITFSYAFAQRGMWIQAYTYKQATPDQHRSGDNRLIFQITKDTVYSFDAGKEEWLGKMVNGFRYKKEGKGFLSADERIKVKIHFEMNGQDQINLRVGDQVSVLTKLKESELLIPLHEEANVVFNHFYTATFRSHKVDTVSFFDDTHKTQYEYENIPAQLFTVNRVLFLRCSFEGEKVYPIIKLTAQTMIVDAYAGEQHQLVFNQAGVKGIARVKKETPVLLSRDVANEWFESQEDALANKELVSRLSLSGQGITEVPRWVKELTHLKQLDLSNNSLTTLPDWLADLKELIAIRLSRNPIEAAEQERLTKLLPHCAFEYKK